MGEDSGFDPCECISGHDSSMSRLLGLLRQTQSYCTDSSCNEQLPVQETSSSDGGMNALIAITAAWGAMMLGMYMFGLTPTRGNTDGKPRNGGNGNDRFDPEPPAIN